MALQYSQYSPLSRGALAGGVLLLGAGGLAALANLLAMLSTKFSILVKKLENASGPRGAEVGVGVGVGVVDAGGVDGVHGERI